MIDHDDLCMFSPIAHLSDIAGTIQGAFSPGTEITVAANPLAKAVFDRKGERFKIPIKPFSLYTHLFGQLLKLRILQVKLELMLLFGQSIQANIITDSLDQCCLYLLDMLLNERNVFIKELFLQGFVGSRDHGNLSRVDNGDQIRQAL